MKNTKLFKQNYVYSLFLFLCIVAGCSRQNEIQRTTKKFLKGFYSYDFKALYDISAPKTLDMIKDMESRVGKSPDLSQVVTPVIDIHEYYEQGDTAYCRYTLKQDKYDTNAISESLMLIKNENKWLVEYLFH